MSIELLLCVLLAPPDARQEAVQEMKTLRGRLLKSESKDDRNRADALGRAIDAAANDRGPAVLVHALLVDPVAAEDASTRRRRVVALAAPHLLTMLKRQREFNTSAKPELLEGNLRELSLLLAVVRQEGGLAAYEEALTQARSDLRLLGTKAKDDPLRPKIQNDLVDSLKELGETCLKVGRLNEKEVRPAFLSERFPTVLPRLAALMPDGVR